MSTETVYSAKEREEILQKMTEASQVFYSMATAIGNHPFIEFTGLMNEYIAICRNAHEQGVDFTQANIHTGGSIPIENHNVAYLGEKLACIYGPSLDEKKAKMLLRAITHG